MLTKDDIASSTSSIDKFTLFPKVTFNEQVSELRKLLNTIFVKGTKTDISSNGHNYTYVLDNIKINGEKGTISLVKGGVSSIPSDDLSLYFYKDDNQSLILSITLYNYSGGVPTEDDFVNDLSNMLTNGSENFFNFGEDYNMMRYIDIEI